MIRQACSEDACEMMRIYNQAVEDQVYANCDRVSSVEEFAREYLGDGQHYAAFVSSSADGGLSGWGALKPFSMRSKDPKMGEVSVYVDRSRRSAGLGVLLLRRLVAHAAGAGFRSLIASIAKKNTQSLRGSKGCGFEERATLPGVATIRGLAEDMVWVERLVSAKDLPREARPVALDASLLRATEEASYKVENTTPQ